MVLSSNKLIVSTKDGRGVFSPFARWDRHPGESFFIDKHEFRIGSDNRVQIPKSFMKELAEKAGVVRPDGRYAIAMQMSAFGRKIPTDQGIKNIRSFGGVVIRNDKLKPYLENGENGQLLSDVLMKTSEEADDIRLIVMDYTDPYKIYSDFGGWE